MGIIRAGCALLMRDARDGNVSLGRERGFSFSGLGMQSVQSLPSSHPLPLPPLSSAVADQPTGAGDCVFVVVPRVGKAVEA